MLRTSLMILWLLGSLLGAFSRSRAYSNPRNTRFSCASFILMVIALLSLISPVYSITYALSTNELLTVVSKVVKL